MKITKIIIYVLYYLAIACSLFINKSFTTGTFLLYLLMTALMPLAIYYFVTKICKLKINDGIIIAYLLFMGIAMTLGHTLDFYRFAGFDKVLHTASGILLSLLILMIYGLLNNGIKCESTKDIVKELLFVNGMNAMIAFLWELFEFSLLVFFNVDSINHYTTGVYDSITDMLVAFIGGLIVSIFIYRYYKTKKNNWFTKVANKFIEDNI